MVDAADDRSRGSLLRGGRARVGCADRHGDVAVVARPRASAPARRRPGPERSAEASEMTAMGGPMEEDDLQARIDERLPPERAEAVDAYLAAHPEARARLSQYAEQRQALRAAFAAQAGRPIPTRLRVAHLLAKRCRRRHR